MKYNSCNGISYTIKLGSKFCHFINDWNLRIQVFTLVQCRTLFSILSIFNLWNSQSHGCNVMFIKIDINIVENGIEPFYNILQIFTFDLFCFQFCSINLIPLRKRFFVENASIELSFGRISRYWSQKLIINFENCDKKLLYIITITNGEMCPILSFLEKS